MSQIQLKRLACELKIVTEEPVCGIVVHPVEDDITMWSATIEGPSETPFEGGKFNLNISFPSEFPFRPPKVVFTTKIFHPNVNSEGSICLDILRDKWASSLTIQKVLLSIISLIAAPNPDDPLMPEIAILYKEDREKYDRTAREWTIEFAGVGSA